MRITTKKCSLEEVKQQLFPDIISFGDPHIFLGERVSFNYYCHLVAYELYPIIIGDDTLVGPFVMMNTSDHGFQSINTLVREQPREFGSIEIGNDVWVAGHVIILRGSKIPDKCVIGAGSVITRHDILKMGGVYAGNPLRQVNQRV